LSLEDYLKRNSYLFHSTEELYTPYVEEILKTRFIFFGSPYGEIQG